MCFVVFNRGCPSICKSADCLYLPVCSSVNFSVSWTADLPFTDIPFFVFFCHVCLFICRLFFHSVVSFFVFFFWQDLDRMEAEGGNPTYVSLAREGAIRIVSYSGKIEGSDSHGEGLRKILYQAYHMLKKVKSVSTCRHFQICRVFPPE